MNPLQSLPEYEHYIYTLPQQFPAIRRSTLTVIRRSQTAGILTGEIEIGEYRLVIREKLSFEGEMHPIVSYGYECWCGNEKRYWYDSQAHPNDPTLASTHPHHKHIPPDIKHHRIPAFGLSFTQPNLPFLIAEIEQAIREEKE